MKTVLVVDDSEVTRKIIRNILTNNGYTVIGEAESGKSGIRKFKELKPDLVTMDINIGDMNAVEALSRIIGINHDAKVVMVSSAGQDSIVVDAKILGARGIILKPFNEKQTMDTLAAI